MQTLAFVVGLLVGVDEMLDDDEVLSHDLENELVVEQVAIDRTGLKIAPFLDMNGRHRSHE